MNKSTGNLWDSAGEGAYARMSQAWQWLCEQRDNAPEGADVWDVRWQALSAGPEWLTDLTHQVLRGEYRLVPLQLQGKNENRKAVWGARDALVLKWTALSLQHLLPLHPACEHVKGHGGGRQSIMKLHGLLTQDACEHHDEKKTTDAPPQSHINDDAVQAAVNSLQYKWVCRTDIRGYYRNIDKQTLLSQVRQHVTSPVLRDLVDQYIHYTVEDGGTFHTPDKGISRGCPLSPLMGALHLYDMDEHFAKQANIHYARYMDDIIILAKSRWSLRRHNKRLMQWFKGYGFEAHPDKTFIGRTEKGFDWMGAWLTHEGVTDIAPRAKANHREKVRRLYERLARVPQWRRKRARQAVNAKVSTYRKRWNIWAGGLMTIALAACGTALPSSRATAAIGTVVRTVPLTGTPIRAGRVEPGYGSGVILGTDATRSGGRGQDPFGACPTGNTAWAAGDVMSKVPGTPNLVACITINSISYKSWWNSNNIPDTTWALVTCPTGGGFGSASMGAYAGQKATTIGCSSTHGNESSFRRTVGITLLRAGSGGAGTIRSDGLIVSAASTWNDPGSVIPRSEASLDVSQMTIRWAVESQNITETTEPDHSWLCAAYGTDVRNNCRATGPGPIDPPKPPLSCQLNGSVPDANTKFTFSTDAYVNAKPTNGTVLLNRIHVPLTVTCTPVPSAAGTIDITFSQGPGGTGWASGSPWGGWQLLPVRGDTTLQGYTVDGKTCGEDTQNSIYFKPGHRQIPVFPTTSDGDTPHASYIVDTWWSLCRGGGGLSLGTTTLPVIAEVSLR